MKTIKALTLKVTIPLEVESDSPMHSPPPPQRVRNRLGLPEDLNVDHKSLIIATVWRGVRGALASEAADNGGQFEEYGHELSRAVQVEELKEELNIAMEFQEDFEKMLKRFDLHTNFGGWTGTLEELQEDLARMLGENYYPALYTLQFINWLKFQLPPRVTERLIHGKVIYTIEKPVGQPKPTFEGLLKFLDEQVLRTATFIGHGSDIWETFKKHDPRITTTDVVFFLRELKSRFPKRLSKKMIKGRCIYTIKPASKTAKPAKR